MTQDPNLPWVPVLTVDLRGLTPKTFEEKQKEFYRATKDRPLNLQAVVSTGWHTITPQIAETALLGKANRKIALADVQHYGRQMIEDKWAPTGETICFDRTGTMRQGYHRMWACYLSGASFRTFVVADIEPVDDLFAFYDAGRRRSNVDALQTAGLNGFSAQIDAVIKIAVRYDAGCYNKKGPKAPRLTAGEVLEYVRTHPELRGVIADTVSEYKSLLDDLFGRQKDVACFAAVRIIAAHGTDVFEDFMLALLDEDNKHGPIFLLRQKLEHNVSGKNPLRKQDVLAFLIKAFNAWHAGQGMKKLVWGTDEVMPSFDVSDADDAEAEPQQQAAE